MQPKDVVALGIDIGGTSTKLAIVAGADGSILASQSIPTANHGAPEVFLPALFDAALALVEPARAEGRMIAGAGAAVAGFLDERRGRLVYNPNLQPLVGYPLLADLSEHLRIPAVLEVDSNAACLAESLYGVGRGVERFLSLSIGTGLGGGITQRSRLLRTSYECVGDIGHVIVDPQGPRCSAGCKGCAEALISAPALEAQALECAGREPGGKLGRRLALHGVLTARDVIELARAGDAASQSLLARTGHWLGIALASMATIFFPDCVAISGGVSEAGALLLAAAERTFRETAAPFVADRVTLCKGTLGARAGVIGAAAGLWNLSA
jgi:glucokinase